MTLPEIRAMIRRRMQAMDWRLRDLAGAMDVGETQAWRVVSGDGGLRMDTLTSALDALGMELVVRVKR